MSSPQDAAAKPLSAKQAAAILRNLIEDARTIPGLAWDSPKRTQWKDTAHGALERAGLGESLLRSFDGSQAFSVGSKTSDEQLRKQMNSSLTSMVAVLQSAIDQLGWLPAEVAEKKLDRKPSPPGFVDSLIIIFVSAALVIFLLWATARTLGLETFEHLPSWLQDSYKAMWTSIAAGTAGIGLAVFKVLTRKEDDPRPNYLLLIAITTASLIGLISILPKIFRSEATTHYVERKYIPGATRSEMLASPQMPGNVCGQNTTYISGSDIDLKVGEWHRFSWDASYICRKQAVGGAITGQIFWGTPSHDADRLPTADGTVPAELGTVEFRYLRPGHYTVNVEVYATCIDLGKPPNSCKSSNMVGVDVTK